MKTRIHLLIGVIILVVFLLSACSSGTTTTTTAPTTTQPPTTTTPASTQTTTPPKTTSATTTAPPPTTTTSGRDPNKYGGIWKLTLTVGPSTPLGYMPEAAPDSYTAANAALEPLISLQKDGTVVPVLATSWNVDSAAKTMTFNLRKGVKFHDGTDFNAQAVKWNYDLVVAAKKAPNISSVDVIDDYTVRINLKVYQNTDFTGMAGGQFQIISPTSFEKNGIEYTRTHPIGTGPFKFVEYQRDSKLVYARNNSYWDPAKPYLDGLEYYVVAEETVRKLLFKRGDVHMIRASTNIAQELTKEGHAQKTEAGGTFVLIPDSANDTSPFAKLKVRQAVSYSIDRAAIAEGLGFGLMRPAYQVYPGNPVAAIPNLPKTEFDKAKAKQLLTEAGYPNGFKATIHTFVRVVNRDFITAIAKMMADVGIQTNPDFPEPGKYEEYRARGWNNALMAHALVGMTNPNQMYNTYFPESNIQFPSVKKPAGFYDAVKASLTSPTLDPVKVQAVYKLMADDFMVIPYVEETVANFYAPGAHDDGGDIFTLVAFMPSTAWLEPSAR
jgi:peptide/nickel transport system substrate-binding protein